MKVYKKIILNKNDEIIYEDSYEYNGKWARLGIHYDYDSTRNQKTMEKKLKRAKKLEERRKKRQEKHGNNEKENPVNKLDTSVPLSLENITDPNKDK